MTDMPPPRRIATNGVTLSVHLAGPETGMPVLLCHGWPELAYSWKNQIGPLAAAGHRVIAPDQRGFGASDAPWPAAAYGIDALVGDLTGLLDALGITRAVLVGHDWGGILAWHAALLAPERVAGVVGVNTPHRGHSRIDPVSMLGKRFGPEHYIVAFQEEGAEEALVGREDDFFAFVFGSAPLPAPADPRDIPARAFDLFGRFAAFTGREEARCVVPAADRAVYAAAYRASGFRGGVNWYRNLAANWARMAGVDHHVRQPALMIAAANDWYLPPALTRGMERLVPDLELHVIEGCGHWTQWEAPETLNRLILAWLARRRADLCPARVDPHNSEHA